MFIYSTHPKKSAGESPIGIVFCQDKVKVILNCTDIPDDAATVGFIGTQGVVTYKVECCDDTFSELRPMMPTLEPAMLLAVSRSRQVIEWQKNYKFCGRCGAATKLHSKEFSMSCSKCKFSTYPRLDPVIMVGVQKGNSLLLARNVIFKNNMFSLIAGYIEGGETVEEAAAREVYEETKIKIHNVRYVKSQMWPFPNALMIGCFADYLSGEPTPDMVEIVEANFFDANNLPNRPSKGSLANSLIDLWLESKSK